MRVLIAMIIIPMQFSKKEQKSHNSSVNFFYFKVFEKIFLNYFLKFVFEIGGGGDEGHHLGDEEHHLGDEGHHLGDEEHHFQISKI